MWSSNWNTQLDWKGDVAEILLKTFFTLLDCNKNRLSISVLFYLNILTPSRANRKESCPRYSLKSNVLEVNFIVSGSFCSWRCFVTVFTKLEKVKVTIALLLSRFKIVITFLCFCTIHSTFWSIYSHKYVLARLKLLHTVQLLVQKSTCILPRKYHIEIYDNLLATK